MDPIDIVEKFLEEKGLETRRYTHRSPSHPYDTLIVWKEPHSGHRTMVSFLLGTTQVITPFITFHDLCDPNSLESIAKAIEKGLEEMLDKEWGNVRKKGRDTN